MNRGRADDELLNLERRYWQAIKEKDASAAAGLSDDPCLVVGPQGLREFNRQELGATVTASNYELEEFSFDDEEVQVRAIGEDVAVLGYKVHERLRVGDQSVEFDAYDTSVWVRRDGRWLCAAHTETLASDSAAA